MRSLFRSTRILLSLGLAAGCGPVGERSPAPSALRLELPAPSTGWELGAPVRYPGYAMRAARFELTPGFSLAALLFEPDAATEAAVIVAHGHYGQGKNAEESRDVAHRLAAAGARVLVVDTPGVEEGDSPARQIHFEAGAHARGFLLAGGASAIALQVAGLRRGLDLLAQTGSRRFAATGASGGATQALYLMLADARVGSAVLASFPDIPRPATGDGCTCDLLPGHLGPDPRLLGGIDRPTLWLSDREIGRPEGLPWRAELEIVAGPHSYTEAMIARAVPWLAERLSLPGPTVVAPVAHRELHTGGVEGAIWALPLRPSASWRPAPAAPLDGWSVDCAGEGPTVLLAGGAEGDADLLRAAGLRACALATPADGPEAELAAARGEVWADRVAASAQAAARQEGAVAVWARRAWALPASALGLPYAVVDPVLDPSTLGAGDPLWVHVPGAWWGVMRGAVQAAVARGEEPASVASALRAALSPDP